VHHICRAIGDAISQAHASIDTNTHASTSTDNTHDTLLLEAGYISLFNTYRMHSYTFIHAHMEIRKSKDNTHTHTHTRTHLWITHITHYSSKKAMGWLWLVGSIKLFLGISRYNIKLRFLLGARRRRGFSPDATVRHPTFQNLGWRANMNLYRGI